MKSTKIEKIETKNGKVENFELIYIGFPYFQRPSPHEEISITMFIYRWSI